MNATVVSHEEWLAARKQFLKKETEVYTLRKAERLERILSTPHSRLAPPAFQRFFLCERLLGCVLPTALQFQPVRFWAGSASLFSMVQVVG